MEALERALLLHPEVLRVGLVFMALATLLSVGLRRERTQVTRLGLLYGLSLLLRVASELLVDLHMPASSRTVGFLALLLQGIAFVGLVGVVVFAVLLPFFRVEAPRILRELTLGLAYLGLIFYLFASYKVDVTSIVATSAVVTAVIGLALQDTLGNVMGGVALQLDGSISVGDWIRVDDLAGLVREITWRHTSVETRDGDTVIVPNSYLVKNRVTRLGARADDPELRQRRWIHFDVDLAHAPAAVLDSVKDAILAPIPNVAASPAPDVVIVDFKDRHGAALYAVRYWLTDLWPDVSTDSIMRKRIYYALKRAGIPLSVPTQHVLLPAEMRRSEVRGRELTRGRARAVLDETPLFRTLTREERDELAGRLVLEAYAPGEMVLEQGSRVECLYVLIRGVVEVRFAATPGDAPKPVTQMKAPETFGEMGLLTGEARTASIVAVTEIECLRLDEEVFKSFVEARPAILEDISRLVAIRTVELESFRENLTEEGRKRRVVDETGSVLRKIQRFLRT